MSHTDTRERRTRAALACPKCGAPIDEPCRKGVHPHDYRRGAADMRPVMMRVHAERRAAWQDMKRQGAAT